MSKPRGTLEMPIVKTSWRRPSDATVYFGDQLLSVYAIRLDRKRARFKVFRPGAEGPDVVGYAYTRERAFDVARRAEEERLAKSVTSVSGGSHAQTT